MADLKTKTADLRRAHIMQAAVTVFQARGSHGATIRHIAMEAGVSDGTIYSVFDSKESLLLAILESLLKAGDAGVIAGAQPGGDAGTDVSRLIHHMVATRWNGLDPDTLAMTRIVLSEALINREMGAQYLESLLGPVVNGAFSPFERLAEDGALKTSDLAMTTRIMVAACLGLVLMRLLGDGEIEARADEVPGQLADLLLNGLLPRSRSAGLGQ